MELVAGISCDALKILLAVEVRMPSVQCLPDKSGFDINDNETILEQRCVRTFPLLTLAEVLRSAQPVVFRF